MSDDRDTGGSDDETGGEDVEQKQREISVTESVYNFLRLEHPTATFVIGMATQEGELGIVVCGPERSKGVPLSEDLIRVLGLANYVQVGVTQRVSAFVKQQETVAEVFKRLSGLFGDDDDDDNDLKLGGTA